MLKTITIVSLVSAILYRLGGIGRPFRSWMRDWVIPLPVCIWLWCNGVHSWWLLLSYALMGGGLTTYYDSVPFNKGKDNFYMHGFFIGLALIPLAAWIPWWAILLRSVVLGALMGIWCHIWGNDWTEELGRGAFIGLTLPILLV